MTLTRLLLSLALFAPMAACAADASEPLSKEQVLQSKADITFDFCEQYGWYDDAICDDFCPSPDPDCQTANNACEEALGVCSPGLLASCPTGQELSFLSCGDQPIETTCCAPVDEPSCPDVCEAACDGEPEPVLPMGCPIPSCQCESEPTCPDVCEAVCDGEPEPVLPMGCPIPSCQCD